MEESLYGLVVTKAGRELLVKLAATGEGLEITKVVFGTGKMPEGSTSKDMMDRTELVAPLAEGTTTAPVYKDDTLSLVAEFRSDLNGGLKETVWLNEFGIYAKDADGEEVLLTYTTLGDYPDSVKAYTDGRTTVRDYPVSITVGAVSDVTIAFAASAFITSEEAQKLIDENTVNMARMEMFDFSVTVKSWKKSKASGETYPYYADIQNDAVTLAHFPDVTPDKDSLDIAHACGLAAAEILEAGKVRLYSMKEPSAVIRGTCILWSKK